MTENRNLQKASSTHSSIQSFIYETQTRSIFNDTSRYIFQIDAWVSPVILTDWQSASLNFFAVQAMKTMEAGGGHKL